MRKFTPGKSGEKGGFRHQVFTLSGTTSEGSMWLSSSYKHDESSFTTAIFEAKFRVSGSGLGDSRSFVG
jgi:hypothetical protein